MLSVAVKGKNLILKPPDEARREAKNFYDDLRWFYLPIGILLSSLFPALGLAFFAFVAVKYYFDIYEEYFNIDKKHYYERIFAPKMKPFHFLQIGYRLDPSELDYHLTQIKGKNFKEYLMGRALQVLKDKWQGWRIVGLAKELLTRHVWLLGASGAGKTETIMTGLKSQAENGGGAIFIDGKADEKMNKQFYSILLKANREGEYYLINFLNVDKYKEHTNTFNPFYTLMPAEAVQFISDLAGGGQGEQAYWKGRGIALLTPATYFVYFRKKFFGEPFSYETIANYLEARSFAFAGAVVYALMLDIENRLKENKNLRYIYERGKPIKIPESEFAYTEVFESYLAQDTEAKKLFEQEGFSFEYLEELLKLFSAFKRYAVDVSTAYWDAMREAGKLFYQKFGSTISTTGIYELRLANEEISKELEQMAGGGGEGGLESLLGGGSGGKSQLLIYSNPAHPNFKNAMQQHQYAQQQWTNVFNFFGLYRHIFGSLHSDIDLADVIRNNKFLYVLLPPLKQSKEVTEFLGKLMVVSISRAVAQALGGPVRKTNDQDEVLKMQITPVPPFLVIADEYGSYPVPGVDTILAQVRSIQISVWISTQDITSLRVGGSDNNSLYRAFGSTSTKIFLSAKDIEAIKFMQDVLPEMEVRQIQGLVDGTDIIDELTFHTQRVPIFDPKYTQAFEKGMSFIFADGEGVLCQMFYVGAKPANKIYLTKYSSV